MFITFTASLLNEQCPVVNKHGITGKLNIFVLMPLYFPILAAFNISYL